MRKAVKGHVSPPLQQDPVSRVHTIPEFKEYMVRFFFSFPFVKSAFQ